MSIYDRIRSLARDNGTTIEDALKLAGDISLNTYNGWKRRKVYPRADEALKIAKVFNVTVEFLLTGKNSHYTDCSQRILNIAKACKKASEIELQMVEKILDIPPAGKNTEIQKALS